MKIIKFLEISQDIEFDVTSEDIEMIFEKNPDASRWLYEMNNIATFFRGTPDVIIEKLTPEQRNLISKFLQEQGARFNFTEEP